MNLSMGSFLLCGVVALSACSLGSPRIIRQSTPNALSGVKSYVVLAVTFDGFTYDGVAEADWLKTRDDQQRQSWANDKLAATDNMRKAFSSLAHGDEQFVAGAQPGSGQHAIAINIDRYDGVMRWEAKILDGSGAVLEEIADPHTDNGRYNTWAALRVLPSFAANYIVEYLRERYRK